MIRFNNVPAPKTIFQGLRKLEPGQILSIRAEHMVRGEIPTAKTYWSCQEVFDRGTRSRLEISEIEAVDQLNTLLLDSTSMRLESDVPVGAFLSGGIDSSLIVALMQKLCRTPVRTFTVGFSDPRYNEAEFAAKIARHLGTEHTQLDVRDEDVLNAVPKMSQVFDEPFSDSSQVPTYLISHLTRQHVTVSLSGDGGDELFAGYNRYRSTAKMWQRFSSVPRPVRVGLAAVLKCFPPEFYSFILGGLAPFSAALRRGSAPGFKVHKFVSALRAKNKESLYVQMISQW
jgi:asparagine synthase (glutamine-hydrolysing)